MNIERKRQHKRAELQARVIAHDQQDFEYLECGTISEGGIFLYTKKAQWEIGSVLKLNIKGKSLSTAFVAEARVLNHVEGEKKGLCAKFLNLSEQDKVIIKDYVSKHVKKEECNLHLTGVPFLNNFRVFINDEEIPKDDLNGWFYDMEKNLIAFRGLYVPREGDKISFAFKEII